MHKLKSNALRKGRASISNQIYLITSVTNKRKPIFTDLYAGRTLVQVLYDASLDATTICYVIMPDHFHWLIQLGETQALFHVMQQIKTRSGFSIKQQLNLKEKIWQAGYHDHALRKEEDIKAVARYISANPLRAGLVSRIEDYSLWDACWVK